MTTDAAGPTLAAPKPHTLNGQIRQLAKKDVTLGDGTIIAVRAIHAWEQDTVADAILRPTPPLKVNPRRGSASEPEPDDLDPVYQGELRAWLRKIQRAELAMAIDLSAAIAPRPEKTAKAAEWAKWIELAGAYLAERFAAPELELLWRTSRELGIRPIVAGALAVFIQKAEPKSDKAPLVAVKSDLSIPENYDVTEDGLLMRAAERFGRDPFTWIDSLNAEQRAAAIAHELIRRPEEVADRAMLRAVTSMIAG